MREKSNPQKQQRARVPSDAQLTALQQSTSARKQATIDRLHTAVEALKGKRREVSVQTVYEECGLRYAAIYRNPEALALFRANSTNLVAKKKQTKRERTIGNEETITPRDPLLAYKKPQLVERLRKAQQEAQTAKQQLAASVDAAMKREAHIAELEAKLAELEPHRAFVEQMRVQMQREEQGRFGNLPPSV